MCIIAVCNERALTDREFNNCFKGNSDGAGFAWREDDKNHYVKGLMSAKDAEQFYAQMIDSKIFPHVIHFRTATAGGVTDELTHPFIVSEESPVIDMAWCGAEPLLFHNGVVTSWKSEMLKFYMARGTRIPNEGGWSDSRFMAILVHYLGVMSLLLEGSKYVLMEDSKTRMYGKFTENKGVYFSNDGYMGATSRIVYGTRAGYAGYGGWWNKEDELYGYAPGAEDKVVATKRNSTGYVWPKGGNKRVNKSAK